MKRYSQQDAKWKEKQLGTGECTIGGYGCFLTCFAMLLEVEPDKVNDRVKTFGGFAGSLISPYVVPNAYKQMYIDSQTYCANTPAPLDTIDRALANGLAVIVQIDTSPSADIQSHFVILTGKVGNDYGMVDPWPLVDEPPATLLGRYGKGRNAETIITYILVIGGVDSIMPQDVNSTDSDPLPVASGGKVRTIARCHLRTYPAVEDKSDILVLPIGKEFEWTGETVTGDGYRWKVVKCYVEDGSLK
jgi:hypothetical protein